MSPPLSYCEAISQMRSPERELHQVYHDTQYGFPIHDDNHLFERLILEVNQAGLNWTTILKKRKSFHEAYDGFDVKKVAGYAEGDRLRLLQNAGIIRNRKKIEAAIHIARVILELGAAHGSFEAWLLSKHPKSLEEWAKLFRKTFVFTGGEIVKEFLTSCGMLSGAHIQSCPIYAAVYSLRPTWSTT